MPRGLCNIICALDSECFSYIHYKGHVEFVREIKCGVLQGCPLAALIFVLAMEPFCVVFNRQIVMQSLGQVHLCADDIGMVLKSWTYLIAAYAIFELAYKAACLRPGAKKCFSVPMSQPLAPI